MPFNPLIQISRGKRIRSIASRRLILFAIFIAGTLVALAAHNLLTPDTLSPFVIGLSWLVFSISIVLGPFLYWYLQPKRDHTPQKDVIDLFIKIASSVVVIAGLVVASLSFASEQQKSQQTLELGQTTLANTLSEQRSQRVVKALEALGSEHTFQRLAGVYACKLLDETFLSKEELDAEYSKLKTKREDEKAETLMRQWNSDTKDHWMIMETLTHFIQETTPIPKPPQKLEEPKAIVEIYEILKYLGTRKLVYDAGEYDEGNQTRRLNLINVDLRGYSFHGGHFQGTSFKHAHLEGADFRCVNLRNTNFTDATLINADLRGADLSHAWFYRTNLSGADLTGARISADEQLSVVTVDKKTKCPDGLTYNPDDVGCKDSVKKNRIRPSRADCLEKYREKE